jgi:hypothetical protein
MRIEAKPGRLRVNTIEFVLHLAFPKAQLVASLMDSEISRQDEAFSRSLCGFGARLVWDSFRSRPRLLERIHATITSRDFWSAVKDLIPRVGSAPVLAVSSIENLALRNLIGTTSNETALPFTHNQDRPENVVGTYVATIDGVEVYTGNFKPSTAWLFSGLTLEVVRYYAVNEAGDHVGLKFEPDQDNHGRLTASIMQVVDWAEDSVFELNFDNSNEDPPT